MLDPPEFPGLAHFCEHMLFLGTEKYPDEGSYKRWVSEHGGSTNAATGPDFTKYMATVAADSLEGLLDRFSQFFVAPLFEPSCVEREVNAVDSEFQRSRVLDPKVAYYTLKEAASRDHAFAKFGSGNKLTLGKEGVHAAVRAFHEKHYSSNIMSACVFGREPTDTLVKWANEVFSHVKDKGLEKRVKWDGTPFPPGRLGRLVQRRPFKDSRTLRLLFPLPFTGHSDDYANSRYVGHVLGHEGEGSATWYLRVVQEYITELSAGELYEASNYSLLAIHINLTEKGLENIAGVVGVVLAMVDVMKQAGLQENIYDEVRRVGELRFDLREKRQVFDFVSSHAQNLSDFGPEKCLTGGYLVPDSADGSKHEQMLSSIRIDRMLAELTHRGIPEDELSETLPWFDSKYGSTTFRPEFLAAVEKVRGDVLAEGRLRMPLSNKYIPEDMSVIDSAALPPTPQRLCEGRTNDLMVGAWHYVDKLFPLPKGRVYVCMLCRATENIDGVLALRLLAQLVDDTLITGLYDALVAGFGFDIDRLVDGLLVDVVGYSDGLPALVADVLEALLGYEVVDRRFDVFKESLTRRLTSERCMQTSVIVEDTTTRLLRAPSYTVEEMLDALKEYTADDLRRTVRKIKSDVAFRVYMHGNMSEECATELQSTVRRIAEKAGCRSECDSWATHQCAVRIPDAVVGEQPVERIFSMKHVVPDDKNAAVEVTYQIGRRSCRMAALVLTFGNMVRPRYFADLRTKQQLAYALSSHGHEVHNVMNFSFMLQSTKIPPAEIHAKIDEFLSTFGETLEALPEEQVKEATMAARRQVLQPSQSMTSEAARLHREIRRDLFVWDRRERVAEELEKITRDDLVAFYRENFWPSDWAGPHNRRVLAVYVYPDASEDAMKADLARPTRELPGGVAVAVEHVPSRAAFRDRHDTYPSHFHY
eukprot:TRINITY_DN47346_c0_g1_i1.p1 TRINITY_DN47346_c0_g1~~TRINITY_DN47346_c0_g1_i1.p1  ORF type:complete len:1000 (+),score=318.32 TRINITY_DN47346_c0_g1_i1:215-3001(+)